MSFFSRNRRRAVAIDDVESSKEQTPDQASDNNVNITLRERLKQCVGSEILPRHFSRLLTPCHSFTWAWFTFPMSTGGIALLLASTPHRFPGLTTIGKVVFIFDLVIFLALIAAITARFIILPGSLQKSLMHPTEALFVPTAVGQRLATPPSLPPLTTLTSSSPSSTSWTVSKSMAFHLAALGSSSPSEFCSGSTCLSPSSWPSASIGISSQHHQRGSPSNL